MPKRALSLLLFVWLAYANALTPAGTVIISQAAAVVSGERYFSNEVRSTVTAVCYVSLLPDGTTDAPGQLTGTVPGGHAYLPYLISNTGNDAFAFPLSVEHRDGSAWTAERAVFYLDENRNGRVDSRERPVERLELPMGESRHLVLEVTAPDSADGSAFLSPVTGCANGRRDAGNIAELRVREGPVLAVETHVDPSRPEPGAEVAFDATLTNVGGAATDGSVELLADLDEERLAGLTYVPSSANASSGLVEFWDGERWSEDEGERVRAVRVTMPDLAQDQQVNLRFGMRIAADADPGPRTHLVEASGPGGPARAAAILDVLPLREHHLGPRDNPTAWPGGEGSEDDLLEIPYLLTGDLRCLELSLINPGTDADAYYLEAAGLPEGLSGTFRTAAGTPLHQPVPLDVGEVLDFEYCVVGHPRGTYPRPPDALRLRTAADVGGEVDLDLGFDMDIVAVSARSGDRNVTRIHVGPVLDEPGTAQTLTADPPRYVEPGSEVTYTLRVENTSPAPIENLRVRLPLPELTPEVDESPRFVRASDGGRLDPDAPRTVVWRADLLPGGTTFEADLVVAMPGAVADGVNHAVPTRFTLTASEIGYPRASNQLVHVFPSQGLEIETSASPSEVRNGETIRYEVALRNLSSEPICPRVATRLPEGTQYVAGSGRAERLDHVLDVEPLVPVGVGAPEPGPRPPGTLYGSGEALRWDLAPIDELCLAAAFERGDALVLAYEAVVLGEARGFLRDLVEASGRITVGEGEHAFDLTVVSDQESREVQVYDDSVLALELSADPERYLRPGGEVAYALRVENTSSHALADVSLEFPIPEFSPASGLRPEFARATEGGAYDGAARTVRWTLPTLGPGEAFVPRVVLAVPEEGVESHNFAVPATFTADAAGFPEPLTSNRLVHVFPSQALAIDTEVAPHVARVGDDLTYTVTVTNPSEQAVAIRLATRLPDGTAYVPGTGAVEALGYEGAFEPALPPGLAPAPGGAVLRAAKAATAGADIESGTLFESGEALRWDFADRRDLLLQPAGEEGDSLTVRYGARLLPGVRGDLLHLAEATGVATIGGFELAVVSNQATVQVEVAPPPEIRLELVADPPLYLRPGAELMYTLNVENTSSVPLDDLRLRFPLPELTPATELRATFDRASDGAKFDPATRTVSWRLPRLEPGERFGPRVVLDLPEGGLEGRAYVLAARFEASAAQVPEPLRSNEVAHAFPSQALLIDTDVTPRVARVGETLAYTVTVTNPSEQAVRVRLATRLPDRTRYVTGTGRVSAFEHEAPFEPEDPTTAPTDGSALRAAAFGADDDLPVGSLYAGGEALRWDFVGHDELILAPAGEDGDRLSVTYEVLLLPGVTGTLVHLAEASGIATVGGHQLAVVSNQATVAVEVAEDVFGDPRGTLTGRVFLDRDGDGRYEAEVDTALEGARLLLANGWQTTTDDRGLYAFRELEPGAWSLLLDRSTVPFPPSDGPGDAASPYLRLSRVRGLAVEDFALAAPRARASAERTTRLAFGPVTIEKRLDATDEGLFAVLTIDASEPLEDLVLTDPLPGGGEEVWTYDVFEGREVLRHELPAGSRLTDPNVRWKDPLR